MSAQHTPGPWKAERAKRPDNTGGYDFAITDQDNQIIAEAFEHTGYAGGTERQYIVQPVEANARLIVRACNLVMAGKALTDAHSAKVEARGDLPADPDWGLSENEIAAARMMNALMAERDDLLEQLLVAKGHIEHMGRFIAAQKAGYAFESIGEDMPGIDAAIAKATGAA